MKLKFKLLAGGVAALGLIGAASGAGAGTRLNLAVAVTGGQRHNAVSTQFQTNTTNTSPINDSNRAQAVSVLCVDCKTVAVAVQIDLAQGPVNAITGINKAVADERRTVNADTCAAAYQFIIAPGEQVSFSSDGSAAINSIKARVAAVARSDESCDSIQSNIVSQMDQLYNVLTDPNSYVGAQPNVAARGASVGVSVTQRSDVKTA
jgi:hypothetical protein